MTENRNFKRRVRARSAKTGESYTAALQHLRVPADSDHLRPPCVRLAVAQGLGRFDPGDIAGIRAAGEDTRNMMRDSRQAGARIIHFAEGSLCSPSKWIVSSLGPDEVGAADWSHCRWDALREEIVAICRLAGELELWTVLGAPHRLSAERRPHSSLYVISDSGELATRYDERMLSHTKLSHMYTPGAVPVTFDVDNVRFGCALGMEAHYPELFIEYERLEVDCVLFSTTGGAAFAAEISGHAASNSYWTSFAVHAQQSVDAPAGIVAPNGSWVARCANATPSVAVADIATDPANPARPWRRTARGDLYRDHFASDDHRSADRRTV